MKESPFLVRPFEIKQIDTDSDSEFFIIKGYASVFGNIDLGGDIVEPGAFAEDLATRGNTRPILWQHYSSEPIGRGTFFEDQTGLHVTMKLPKDDTFVSGRVMPQIKIGSVTGISFGYKTIDSELEENGKIRRLIKLQFREASPVTFPMNERAQINDAKQFLDNIEKKENNKPEIIIDPFKELPIAEIDTNWDTAEAVKQIKENTGSTEKPSANYGIGFMYSGEKEEKDFSEYKFPYVDYIDNKFVAVPKGLSIITGALAGDNTGLRVPQPFIQAIKKQINKYYAKMGREEPFKNDVVFIDVFDLKNMATRDKPKIFDKNIILSTSAKEHIADLLCCPDSGGDVDQGDDLHLREKLEEINKLMED